MLKLALVLSDGRRCSLFMPLLSLVPGTLCMLSLMCFTTIQSLALFTVLPCQPVSLIPNAQAAVSAAAAGALVTNATSVNYFDEANQVAVYNELRALPSTAGKGHSVDNPDLLLFANYHIKFPVLLVIFRSIFPCIPLGYIGGRIVTRRIPQDKIDCKKNNLYFPSHL